MGTEFVDYCAHIKNAEIERLQPDVSDWNNSECFEKASSTVIARNEATKQSRRFPRKNSGLLRLRAMTAKNARSRTPWPDEEISRNQSKRDDRDHHPQSPMKSGDALRG